MDTILKATRYALEKKLIDFKIEDEKSFVISLRENGLSGLIFTYIQDGLGSSKLDQYKTQILYDYALRDEKQLKLIDKLREILNEHAFKHVFLKGPRLKSLYEKSYMRGMGDIDILVESFEMKRIEAVLSNHGFKVEQKSPAHDAYSYEGLEVEIHPTLMNDFNPKYELFKDAFSHAIQKELFEYVFEPNFETLYLMYHLAKHFESSGVGLRSILDIGLYVRAYASILDKSTLESYLTSMSMTRFYNVMLELNKRYFGIESDLQIGAFTFTEEEYTNVSNYIMTSGIHGSGHSFNQMAPRLVNTQNKKQSKWFVLVKVLFPSYKNMRIMYPKLKTRLLLPVFYLIRFFNLTIKRGKDSRMKLRQLEDSSKNKEAVKQVFKTLGL